MNYEIHPDFGDTRTEKRKATEAMFRQKIDERVAWMNRNKYSPYEIDICLRFARFAIRTFRELEEAERKARIPTFEHPDDCICARCEYRPEVERSVEEVDAIEGGQGGL